MTRTRWRFWRAAACCAVFAGVIATLSCQRDRLGHMTFNTASWQEPPPERQRLIPSCSPLDVFDVELYCVDGKWVRREIRKWCCYDGKSCWYEWRPMYTSDWSLSESTLCAEPMPGQTYDVIYFTKSGQGRKLVRDSTESLTVWRITGTADQMDAEAMQRPVDEEVRLVLAGDSHEDYLFMLVEREGGGRWAPKQEEFSFRGYETGTVTMFRPSARITDLQPVEGAQPGVLTLAGVDFTIEQYSMTTSIWYQLTDPGDRTHDKVDCSQVPEGCPGHGADTEG